MIRRLREEITDIVLRTTLITGFPGETEEDFEILCGFVREARFERLGVFPYSREEGTPAAELKPQVPERTKLRRQDRLMQIEQEIAFSFAAAQTGRELSILVEGYDPDNDEYIGRSYMDAPDIDALVYVAAGGRTGVMSGEILRARITGSDGYDLLGEMLADHKEG